MDVQRNLEAEHPWVGALRRYVQPDWDDVVSGEWATSLENGSWSTEAIRGWLLQFYPFVHTFPKFLAEALIKVEDDHARAFLIDNIRVEKQHAEHWLWMAEGFGIPRREMLALASGERPLLRDVQSLSDWIWYINAKGSLAEAIAATSFAIEGATGDLTRKLLDPFEAYGRRVGVTMSPRTSKWFRNHARYDDDHPKIALEIIVNYAQTDQMRLKVMAAARRSLQLMNLALLTSCREYSDTPVSSITSVRVSSLVERRCSQQPIPFPDRRLARVPMQRRAS